MKEVTDFVERHWLKMSIGILLTGKMIMLAYEQRGKFLVGGEMFILLIFFGMSYLARGIQDLYIDLMKYKEEEDAR